MPNVHLEGEEMARSLKCGFMETSAKSEVNVDNAFYEVVRRIRRPNDFNSARFEEEIVGRDEHHQMTWKYEIRNHRASLKQFPNMDQYAHEGEIEAHGDIIRNGSSAKTLSNTGKGRSLRSLGDRGGHQEYQEEASAHDSGEPGIKSPSATLLTSTVPSIVPKVVYPYKAPDFGNHEIRLIKLS
jgi:hypothetical protein